MNNNPEENGDQIQIELPEDVGQGIYANLAVIAHSSSEFVIDFVRILPGMPKTKVQSRIILAPEHAKRLLYALNDNINKFESEFNTIQIERKTLDDDYISPINGEIGEA